MEQRKCDYVTITKTHTEDGEITDQGIVNLTFIEREPGRYSFSHCGTIDLDNTIQLLQDVLRSAISLKEEVEANRKEREKNTEIIE